MFSLLEGAFYTDMGNILLIPGHNKPVNGVFRWNTFYKQIAVSSGFGLRFNFNYFIFRVDLGLKVRNPAIHKWITEYSQITHEDLGLSFAIGYPF
jgi:putative salt-induced outer membrane protein YdiY